MLVLTPEPKAGLYQGTLSKLMSKYSYQYQKIIFCFSQSQVNKNKASFLHSALGAREVYLWSATLSSLLFALSQINSKNDLPLMFPLILTSFPSAFPLFSEICFFFPYSLLLCSFPCFFPPSPAPSPSRCGGGAGPRPAIRLTYAR